MPNGQVATLSSGLLRHHLKVHAFLVLSGCHTVLRQSDDSMAVRAAMTLSAGRENWSSPTKLRSIRRGSYTATGPLHPTPAEVVRATCSQPSAELLIVLDALPSAGGRRQFRRRV
eukprot:scaffold3362_cov402-Prasinococcus_capsulatus_cf.AAC.10